MIYEEYNRDITSLVGDELLNNKNNMSNMKRFAVSSLTTFVASFALAFSTAIQVDGFTFSKATLLAVGSSALMVAIRAVAKIGMEWATGVIGDKVVE